MKQVYICEKCGQEFDNWDAAYECENGHITSFSPELEPEIAKRLIYAQGNRAPNEMILTELEETWNPETDTCEKRFTLYQYRLVRRVPESQKAEILAEYEKRRAEEQRVLAEWREKWKQPDRAD